MIVPGTLDSSRRTGWPLSSVSPVYGALETASASARAYIRATLAGWRMAHMTDDGEAVVAELIANAVNASRSRQGGFIYINGRMPTIRVCLLTGGSQLLIECWDEAPGVPQLRQIDYATAESGRGLNMINALSGGEWGWHQRQGRHGKCVWAVVPPTGAAGDRTPG